MSHHCTFQSLGYCDRCESIAEAIADKRHRDWEDDFVASDGADADYWWPRGFGGDPKW